MSEPLSTLAGFLAEVSFDDLPAPAVGRVAVAVLLPASAREREAVEFYETACRNRGWDVSAFATSREAVAWLTEGATS